MVKEPEPIKAPEASANGDATAAVAPFNAGDAMEAIVKLLDKSVKLKETRMLMGRLLRQTAQLRKHMTAADLRSFLTKYVSEDSGAAAELVQYLPDVSII
jgi:26S proteasome regulatory subunit N3